MSKEKRKKFTIKTRTEVELWTWGLDPFLGTLAITSIYVPLEEFVENTINSEKWHTEIFENRKDAEKALRKETGRE